MYLNINGTLHQRKGMVTVMETSLILDYLSELSQNNNREWYHAHKELPV